MALDKAVDSTRLDADLTSVANAIRTKGGASAQLAFPTGFVSAIGDIETGGGYSISAVFTQGNNRIFSTDDLDVLRPYLVVTAHYSDNTSETITEYSLSGTLAVGVSTITVEVLDLTTTFAVTVTEATDVTPAWSSWEAGSGVTIEKDDTGKTIHAHTTYSGTWRLFRAPFTFEDGASYRVSAHINYFAGACRVTFANSSGTMLNAWSNGFDIVESTDVLFDVTPSDNTQYYTPTGFINVCLTRGTSMSGRVTASKIKIIKYSNVDPEQALNILMGGESA